MSHSWNGNTSGYSRDIAYNYADGTAAAWDQKMRRESEDERRAEDANPNVYRPEDGHAFEVSPWPSQEGRCRLCNQSEVQHINHTRKES